MLRKRREFMKRVLPVLLCIFSFISINASDFIVNYKSVDIAACGTPSTFEITVVNTSGGALNNFTFNLNQLAGLDYLPGTVTVLTEQNITNLNNPIFQYNGNLALADSVTFTYQSKMDCNPGAFQDVNQIQITYTGGIFSETTPPYNILFPVVALANTQHISPATYNGYKGEVITRQIEITNSGTANLTEFVLVDDHGSSISMTMSPGTHVNNGTVDSLLFNLTDFAAIGYPNGLPPGQSIFINQTITLDECTDYANNNPDGKSDLTITSSCKGNVCQSASTTAQIIVVSANPDIKVGVYTPRPVCYGSNNQYTSRMRIRNDGVGVARNVDVYLDHRGTGYFTYMVPGSFTYSDSNGNPVTVTDSSVNYSSGASDVGSGCISGSVNKKFITIPEIKPGEYIDIRFDLITCCEQVCNSLQRLNRIYYSVHYTYNECLGVERTRRAVSSYTQPYPVNSANISYTGENGIAPFGGDTLDMNYTINDMSIWPGDSSANVCIEMEFSNIFTVTEDLYILKQNGDTLKPSSFSLISGSPTVYRACFPIDSFPKPSYSNKNDISWGGSIDNLNWDVKFGLTASCPAGNGPFSVNFNLNYQPSQNCPSSCEFQLTCHNLPVTVNCPNCDRQGIHNNRFTARRINYGLPDNNNDGIPDATGTLDFSKVETTQLMVGDTLQTKLECEVVIDDNYAPFPFPYGDSLRYAYAKHTGMGNYITPIYYEIDFTEASSGNNYVIQLPSSSSYKNGGAHILDYSLDTLHKYGLPTTITRFHDGDLVNIFSYYRVTGNIGIDNITTFNIIQESTLGAVQGYDNLIDSPPYTVTDSTHQADLAWRCYNHLSYAMTLVGYKMFQTTRYDDNSGIDHTCNRYLYYEYTFMVGDRRNQSSIYAGNNAFPYEYRVWNILDEIKFLPPTDFDYQYARIRQHNTFYSSGNRYYRDEINPITPDNVVNDTLIFDINQYYNPNVSYTRSDNFFLPSDDDFRFLFYVYLKPRCYTPADSLIEYEIKTTIDVIDSWELDTTIMKNLDSRLFRSDRNYAPYLTNEYIDKSISAENTSYRDYDNMVFRKPKVETEASLPTLSGIDKEVCWDLLLENKTNSASASNVWIAYYSPSGNVNVTGIYNANNNNPYSSSSGIFELGDLSRYSRSSSSRDLRLCATYKCDPKPDSVLILTGWDCLDYPSSISTYPCHIDTTVLYVYPEVADIQAVVTNQSSSDICAPIFTELFVNISDVGTIRNLNVDVNYPNGVSQIPGTATLEYPAGATPVSIPDGVNAGAYVKWVIDSVNSTIETNGVPGGARDPGNNTLYLRFESETDCDYQSTLPITFNIWGINNCRDTVRVAINQAIAINGRDTISRINQKISYDTLSKCDSIITVKVKLVNSGVNTFNGSEGYILRVPNGNTASAFNFTSGGMNFDSIVNFPTYKEHYYSVSSLISSGDSIVFTVDISSQICSNTQIIATPTVDQRLFCARNSTYCGMALKTSFDTVNLISPTNFLTTTAFDTICLNDSISYQEEGCGRHKWFLNGVIVSIDSNYAYQPTKPGTDTIVHTISNMCGVDSSVHYNLIYPLPSVMLIHDTLICEDDSLAINIYENDIISYQWSDLNSDSIRSLYNAGLYSVTLTDTNGCMNIDTVNLRKNPPITLNLIDTAVCLNDSILIQNTQHKPYYSYTWDNALDTNQIYSYGGTHTVIVTDTIGCSVNDTVYVRVDTLPTPIILGDTVFCIPNKITLQSSPSNYESYEWSSGSSSPSILADSGSYYVTVTDLNGCEGTSPIHHIVADVKPFGTDFYDMMCDGDTMVLTDTTKNVDRYVWSTGDTTPVITVYQVGTHTLELTNRCGTDTAYYIIDEKVFPLYDIGEDQTICLNDPATFNFLIDSSDYIWYFNGNIHDSVKNTIKVYSEGEVVIHANRGNCFRADTAQVYVEICVDSCTLMVPNSFTPNGDGVNDYFYPIMPDDCEYTKFSFMVFNRWGEVLFNSELPNLKWDGTYKGQMSKTDTYIWKISYQVKGKNEQINKIGHINLLR